MTSRFPGPNMSPARFRLANAEDIRSMSQIRAREWGEVTYWERRISGYLEGTLSPGQALSPRTCYVAVEDDAVVGFIAGHLTRRYACDGELEWINVLPEHRSKGIASSLLKLLAAWFVEQGALKICVDADPENEVARAFYRRHGAEDLNKHWLVWNDIRSLADGPTAGSVVP
jgi:GNAT superfamily N-acetyltransferase